MKLYVSLFLSVHICPRQNNYITPTNDIDVFPYTTVNTLLICFQMKRQQRKLNFLITQTELYAHFMARKMTGGTEKDKERILGRLDEKPLVAQKSIDGTTVTDVIGDQYGV